LSTALESTECGEHLVDGLDTLRLRERVAERLGPQRIDPGLIHEARKEVADFAFLRAGVRRLRLDDDVANRLLRLLRKKVEGSVARLVGGDLGAVDPALVDVTEQIVLRSDRRLQLVVVDSGGEGRVGHA
jgi:hypothetical protein